jgi:hypothetical protein
MNIRHRRHRRRCRHLRRCRHRRHRRRRQRRQPTQRASKYIATGLPPTSVDKNKNRLPNPTKLTSTVPRFKRDTWCRLTPLSW